MDGRRRHVASRQVFETWFRWVEVVRVPDTQLALQPVGAPLGLRDGSIVRAEGGNQVFVISNGQRRHITNPTTFDALGYRWTNLRVVGEQDLALHPLGPAV
jgi:hypothetical protein